MTSRDAPLRYLAKLAPHLATRWEALGTTLFAGEVSLATDNSVYRFRNGLFISRAKRPAHSFEAPKAMRGMILVGFLHEDHANDLWSLGPPWRTSAHAVLWRQGGTDPTSFVLTSPTTSFTVEPEPRPQPEPEPWITSPRLGVRRPPSFRMPLPPSMTRIHHACAVASER